MPELGIEAAIHEILSKAVVALARLDSGNLEELVEGSEELRRNISSTRFPPPLCNQAGLRLKLAALATVLEATRANLAVLRQLENLRYGCDRYVPGAAQACRIEEDRDGVH